MARLPKAHVVAALVLLAGVSWPAAADEGPAINPTLYQVPAGAKTLNVDCDAKQTLAAALADKSPDLNIVFSGTCKEYIYIQRDGVALRGKDANATVAGAVEVSSARRVLLENFTCRDNAQLEYCVGAVQGASVVLHNVKVFNSGIRGVMVFDSTAIIDGLSVDQTVSTSLLVRGSDVRLEGQLSFSNTVEGCVVVDGASSVFSKNSMFAARDCAAGLIVQNNSTFQAPFATFNLSANRLAGLMLLTHGTFSYGGSIVARNNGKAGIYLDDVSSFAPFSNITSGSTVTLENNGSAGLVLKGASLGELANVVANSGSKYGVLVDSSMLRIHDSKVTDNTTADIHAVFGSRLVFGDGATIGTFTCDGTQQVRGGKGACTTVAEAAAGDAKPGKAVAAKTENAGKPSN